MDSRCLTSNRNSCMLLRCTLLRCRLPWSNFYWPRESPNFTFARMPLLLCACLFWISAPAFALDPPTGKVLLKVSGTLHAKNVGNEAHWDIGLLESLPTETIRTSTPWSEGVFEWQGIRIDVFLNAMGINSTAFTAAALDDYAIEFLEVDIAKYPVIIAYKQDANYISVRQLGPLRIIFPFDDYPELHTQNNLTMSVWQLNKMIIH